MSEKIREIISELVVKGATPGVNYAVIKDNKVIEGSIGLKSNYDLINGNIVKKDEANSIETLYDIASLTKVVCTLTIIFRLYEKGMLDINDSVKKYLPNFKYSDITIYDLLTHTSGIQKDFNSKEIITKEEVIKKIYSLEPINPKGTFLYSDIGYILLGFVIEKICEEPLDIVFKNEVAIPLEMNNTCFNPKNKNIIAPTEITQKRDVKGFVHDEKAYSLNGVAGSAGLFSNVHDLVNFSKMILNSGMFNGRKYLSKNTIDKFFNPLVTDQKYSRSFCFYVGDNPNVINNRPTISFTGFTGPSISIDRTNKISIIMLTNRIHPSRNNKLISILRSKISDEIYNTCLNYSSNIESNYDKTKIAFDNYIEECRKRIKDTFFKQDYLKEFRSLKNNLVKAGKINKESSIEDAIKFERLGMIDIKINHTMRVVKNVMRIAEKMGTNIDFNNVLKTSALLHDIGRFDQATWNNSFKDSCYKDIRGINNHAIAGYHILFVNGRIKDFNIDKRFYPAIGSVIYNHGNSILTGDLAIKVSDINQLDVSKLTGSKNLNDDEKIIVATLVQMVRDVDMLDILYQHLTGEFPVIREYVSFDILGESIEDIANYWNISPKDILDYNKIDLEDLKNMKQVKIPVNKIDLKKLSVPLDIKQKFFNNDNIDLKEIMARRDWTFITGMWWRLNHFLNNISFTANLDLIQEKNLLDRIYNEYSDEYKFLVSDAFDYAKSKLVSEPLKNSKDIYINKVLIKK